MDHLNVLAWHGPTMEFLSDELVAAAVAHELGHGVLAEVSRAEMEHEHTIDKPVEHWGSGACAAGADAEGQDGRKRRRGVERDLMTVYAFDSLVALQPPAVVYRRVLEFFVVNTDKLQSA